ncbi:hypothetical protein M2305_003277 [Gluconobacter cerinus]|uniref:hypothetical protein n=1 Tax=Gluconobacter cerinus TaxID=38307 RepID=UPI001B8D00A4|nr:hypothetical protein [Gluconobacter cerinus]MBS0984566.1 hypothetical protein [Gluconobacter cerinus]MBS0984569.1 hypothetical protein [Gluconobacter cerinus]MCW2267258.1 hypothetical protein [Gluconobacter cerinus]
MDVLTALQNMLEFSTAPLLKLQALIKIIEQYGYNSELKQVTNSNSDYAVVRFYALVLIGSVVSDIEFQSSTDSRNIADQLNDIYESEYDFQTDMSVFEYLSELQAQTVNIILSDGYGLPTLTSYTSKSSMPACSIAQQLYQDGSRTDEIIIRNNSDVTHPLFMPLTVEVLNS